ncbi:hypothetical protein PAAG_12236 [Paracoccidioides lutzii Pb01]|uniref:Uncharacterized protein n=1 Tax=Paracoccidioides lutzii (strain ATCC MYA-826 / Pb01) TaxID=502779 RepID=A0A0A2V0T4_PARBA|nr:hypothetical protein PAAG_12236 [Paracoccidioides lutzii Pb01]KGQ01108.1 hypothetical protein PAAG_12236 [Paracoccidioides lutzii Pb01]
MAQAEGINIDIDGELPCKSRRYGLSDTRAGRFNLSPDEWANAQGSKITLRKGCPCHDRSDNTDTDSSESSLRRPWLCGMWPTRSTDAESYGRSKGLLGQKSPVVGESTE